MPAFALDGIYGQRMELDLEKVAIRQVPAIQLAIAVATSVGGVHDVRVECRLHADHFHVGVVIQKIDGRTHHGEVGADHREADDIQEPAGNAVVVVVDLLERPTPALKGPHAPEGRANLGPQLLAQSLHLLVDGLPLRGQVVIGRLSDGSARTWWLQHGARPGDRVDGLVVRRPLEVPVCRPIGRHRRLQLHGFQKLVVLLASEASQRQALQPRAHVGKIVS
mmetsp:Transcript_85702/g.239525  ORF Transcript_85702/g.239525 Transcript_85702/m.239525 type:complete len:222 (+) Transcript_85702:1153-1818(+)